MRTALITLFTLLFTPGCGKKTAPEPAASAPEEAAPEAIAVEMPAGTDAKTFAKKLIDLEITNFKPNAGGSSVKFIYSTMDFKPDGTWSADASLEASFEEIPCQESGTWAVAEAQGPTVATITWTTDKTSCPMREAGDETRGQVTLGKGTGFSVAFR